MKWYLLRHGEIESNIRKIYAGRSDERLTSEGRRQARTAADALAPLGITAIYSSPLRRALQTAEIIGSVLGKLPVAEESLREMDLGVWEGRSEEAVAREFPEEWRVWNSRPAELLLEGRETLRELLDRVLAGLRKIGNDAPDGPLLLVTHVAVIRVLLMHERQMDLNAYKTIDVPNCKIFEIDDQMLSP